MTDRLVERIVIAWGSKPQKDTWEEDCDYARDAIAIVLDAAAKWHIDKGRECRTRGLNDSYHFHMESSGLIRALAEDKG